MSESRETSRTSIVDAFAEIVTHAKGTMKESQEVKKTSPRLKQLQYDEVLTTEEVIARLKPRRRKNSQREQLGRK